jgi:general secretion pathway protein K
MSPHANPARQKGLALIVALLVVAIVAAMVFLFTARQQLWMRQLENRKAFTSASMIAFAAIDMTRLTLRDDARNNQVDHLLEPWTIPIPPIAVEEGHIAGRLNELQGHFNLTNLLPPNGAAIKPEDAALQRLALSLGVPNQDIIKLLQAFQDLRKIEPDSTPDLSELLRRAVLPAGSSETLSKRLVLLPEVTPINVNFADAESLQASIAGLSASDASAVIARRTGQPFMNLDAFKEALPEKLRANLGSNTVAVQSSYFRVEIDAWFNEVHLGYEAMLKRDGTNLPLVLWTRRASLVD